MIRSSQVPDEASRDAGAFQVVRDGATERVGRQPQAAGPRRQHHVQHDDAGRLAQRCGVSGAAPGHHRPQSPSSALETAPFSGEPQFILRRLHKSR